MDMSRDGLRQVAAADTNGAAGHAPQAAPDTNGAAGHAPQAAADTGGAAGHAPQAAPVRAAVTARLH
jgi:hypothetical protein